MLDHNRRRQWRALLVTGVAGLALVALFKIALASGVNHAPAPQQEVFRLETRINQLEQRLIQIDATLRNLQQQARLGAGAAGRGVSAQEVEILRTQIQALQVRLAEHECALAKLDERTLSPAMRNSRKQSGVRSDPCRINPDTPVRLPERQ